MEKKTSQSPKQLWTYRTQFPCKQKGGMQHDCMQIQISRSQIPHTLERQIQTTLNTGNM